jgi:hypothetical protein
LDEAEFKEIVERLKQANEAVAKLDPAIRAEAFAILRPYVEGDESPGRSTKKERSAEDEISDEADDEPDTSDLEELIQAHEVKKPSDAVLLLAAYLFSQYGKVPFEVNEITELGEAVGLTVPRRIDMTLEGTKRDKKSLFRRAGRGKFAPTVHGELFFKEEYDVKKGRKKRTSASDS